MKQNKASKHQTGLKVVLDEFNTWRREQWFLIKLFIMVKFTKAEQSTLQFFGFKDHNGAPKQCINCGNRKFEEEVTDRIEYHVSEKKSLCTDCHSEQGYWAYGCWDPHW